MPWGGSTLPGTTRRASSPSYGGSPDGLTRSVVLSLGTGLSLLVAVALSNAALVDDLQERLPEQAPDYFLLDIAPSELAPEEAAAGLALESRRVRNRIVQQGFDRMVPPVRKRPPPMCASVLRARS